MIGLIFKLPVRCSLILITIKTACIIIMHYCWQPVTPSNPLFWELTVAVFFMVLVRMLELADRRTVVQQLVALHAVVKERQQRQRFEYISDNSTDLIAMHSLPGPFSDMNSLAGELKFEYASAAANKLLGKSPRSLQGLSLIDMVHPEDRPQLVAAIRQLLDGQPYGLEDETPQHSWMSSAAARPTLEVTDPTVPQAALMFCTPLANQQSHSAERQRGTAASSSSRAVMPAQGMAVRTRTVSPPGTASSRLGRLPRSSSHDSTMSIDDATPPPRPAKVQGLPAYVISGGPTVDTSTPYHSARQALVGAQSAQEASFAPLTLRIQHTLGRWTHVQIRGSVTERGLVCIYRDLTEAERLQTMLADAQVAEARRLAAEHAMHKRRQFFAYIMHELRGPLQSIKLAVDLCTSMNDGCGQPVHELRSEAGRMSDTASTLTTSQPSQFITPSATPRGAAVSQPERSSEQDAIAEMLNTVTVAMQGMQHILDDTLTMTKLEQGHIRVMRQPAVLRRLLDNLYKQHSLRAAHKQLVLTSAQHIDMLAQRQVMIDGPRVQQVLQNFLSNAVKLTQQGSIVLGAWLVPNARLLQTRLLQEDVFNAALRGAPPPPAGAMQRGLAGQVAEEFDKQMQVVRTQGDLTIVYHARVSDEAGTMPLDCKSQLKQSSRAASGTSVVDDCPDMVWARLWVRDTGPGLTEADAATLFMPYMQTAAGAKEESSTGLGLSICRQLAVRMGGGIGVLSKPGQGAMFFLDTPLPMVYSQQLHGSIQSSTSVPGVRAVTTTTTSLASGVPQAQDSDDASAERRGMHVLRQIQHAVVVDDSAVNRSMLARALSRAGVKQVSMLDDGEALQPFLCKLAERGQPEPELITLDYQMPVLCGPKAAAAARAAGYTRCIIGVTGNASADDDLEFQQAGVEAVLHKPVGILEIAGALGRMRGTEESVFPA